MRGEIIRIILVASGIATACCWVHEEERVQQWRKEHGEWPSSCLKESVGYRDLQTRREWEIMQLRGREERWANWHQYVLGRITPAFTERGFELATTPPAVFKKLRDAVDAGLARWEELETEHRVKMLYNSNNLQPKFVDMQSIADEVLHEMTPIMEEWSGLKLRPTSAYGVRLYRNGSSLGMHHDRVQTHVISAIIHIAHRYDDDANPWPIEIESHATGTLASISLEEGQMLFYESAKSLHGRITEFRGKYYGSLYIHYAPVNKRIWNFDTQSVVDSIPPHWDVGAVEEDVPYEGGACLTVPSRRAVGAPPPWTDRPACSCPASGGEEVATCAP